MTRLITDGFEIGEIDSARYPACSGVIESTTKRTGSYSVKTRGNWDGGKTYIYCALDEAVSEIFVRLSYYASSTTAALYVSLKNGTTELITLKKDSGGAGISLYVGASEIVDSGVFITALEWNLLEVHAKIDNSSGLVEVKLDGRQIISYSGDTQPGANTTIDRIVFGNSTYFGGGTGTEYLYWDDFAVNDTDGVIDNSWCGDGHVIALTPNASGDSNMFTPSSGSPINNYTMVDEVISDSDTTYVQSVIPDNYDLYNVADSGLSPALCEIARSWLVVYAKDTTTGSGVIKSLVKTNGEIAEVQEIPIYLNYMANSYCDLRINPVTLCPWTIEEIDALQIGFKVVR